MLKAALITCATLLLCFSMDFSRGETEPAKFIPFSVFIQKVKDADSDDFVGRPASKVKDAASFREMREHILSLYEGVHVSHSYVLGSQTFDCIPVEEQPALRGQGKRKIASEPPRVGGSIEPSRAQVSSATVDPFGNDVGCEAHTIPMRRITLEQVSRFRTLQEFLSK